MMKSDIRTLELLAPARNFNTAVAAIRHGADAVYIGGPAFGARLAAGNAINDIERLVKYAHQYKAKVYVTLNTILYDSELARAKELIMKFYRIGVDAVIVQDLGLLEMDIPPIALHASTQCDTRSVNKAKFLEDAGFSQIVLARELSLDEIKNISRNTQTLLEGFVHGALCVSYSGDCHASFIATGRSANRGECSQMCRLAYDLIDDKGNVLIKNRYLLSLRDMNRLDNLREMADAGISSFKIEGRLKDEAYVKNVVAAYSQALDALVASSGGKYRRTSCGKVNIRFQPDVRKSFNRGFTSYFIKGDRREATSMANFASPKWIGEPIGKVRSVKGCRIALSEAAKLNNGDGVGYFDLSGKFCGFRVNRSDSNTIYTSKPVSIASGTTLYRNADKEWDDMMACSDSERRISVAMTLRAIGNRRISLKAEDERGCYVEVTAEVDLCSARTTQEEPRRRILERLGNSVYYTTSIIDNLGNLFVAASVLAELRRRAIERLDAANRMTYRYEYRNPVKSSLQTPERTSYHDNISNTLAETFYKKHGTRHMAYAIEVINPRPNEDLRVMTTRYCLRREMGVCIKGANGNKLPQRLFLRAPVGCFRLDFDCKNCEMRVVKVAQMSEK